MSEWVRQGEGHYVLDETPLCGLAVQEGETWWSLVSLSGKVVYKAEWDSRSLAMQNAVNAMRRARWIRNPKKQRDDEDD